MLGVADAEARAAAEEARTVFERVGSLPLLERLAGVAESAPVAETAGDREMTARPPSRA